MKVTDREDMYVHPYSADSKSSTINVRGPLSIKKGGGAPFPPPLHTPMLLVTFFSVTNKNKIVYSP